VSLPASNVPLPPVPPMSPINQTLRASPNESASNHIATSPTGSRFVHFIPIERSPDAPARIEQAKRVRECAVKDPRSPTACSFPGCIDTTSLSICLGCSKLQRQPLFCDHHLPHTKHSAYTRCLSGVVFHTFDEHFDVVKKVLADGSSTKCCDKFDKKANVVEVNLNKKPRLFVKLDTAGHQLGHSKDALYYLDPEHEYVGKLYRYHFYSAIWIPNAKYNKPICAHSVYRMVAVNKTPTRHLKPGVKPPSATVFACLGHGWTRCVDSMRQMWILDLAPPSMYENILQVFFCNQD